MKKKYTKKQIQEAINYWQKQLKAGNYKKVNESVNDTAGILQAIAVGLLNDNAFNPSGIYGNSGIYWEYPEDNVKYVIEVTNVRKVNDNTYVCDVSGGLENQPFKQFGQQNFTVDVVPQKYDFDAIVDYVDQCGVRLGNMSGFANAFDAHIDAQNEYDLS